MVVYYLVHLKLLSSGKVSTNSTNLVGYFNFLLKNSLINKHTTVNKKNIYHNNVKFKI